MKTPTRIEMVKGRPVPVYMTDDASLAECGACRAGTCIQRVEAWSELCEGASDLVIHDCRGNLN